MKGMVWYYTYEDGVKQLKQIQNNYDRMKIKTIRERLSRFGSFIEFENGDIWKLASGTESSKGNKINVSYIDRRIERDAVRCIIEPCTMAYPFQAFRYYGPYPEEEVENRWIIS